MSNRIKNNLKNLVGQTLNQYYSKVKPTISDLRYKQEYQNRIIECMVGEVDDNYITTPETDSAIVKLEHSKEGLVKVPTIKGKTILVDAEGNETDTPGEGCRLVSVGEDEDNKMIILSKNKNIVNRKVVDMGHSQGTYVTNDNGGHARPSSIEYLPKGKYMFSIDGYDVSNFVDASIIIWKEDLSTQTWRRTKINRPFEILDGEVGFTWYGAVNAEKGETITQLVGKNIQVELGETRTSYVEPKQHKTEILLDRPLNKLNKTWFDEIVDNKVIYNTNKMVLDGSENWYGVTNSQNPQINTKLFILSLPYNSFKSSNFKSSCFEFVNAWMQDKEGMQLENKKDIRINISREKLGDKTINQWLSENPIELIYVPSEPTVIEIPNSLTLQGFDDTTMYIENSITPTVQYGYNALIPYKEELSKQKEEVETNTLDIEQNIIPYLMDMEFNLMLMEDN